MDLSLYTFACPLFLCVQILFAENRVALLNCPEEAVPDHRLKVLFSCDRPASVRLHCLVSFESGSVLTLDLRSWRCDSAQPRTRAITLGLPDWLVYRPDGTVPLSQWVLSCLLRVSLTFADDSSMVSQDVRSMEPKPLLSRPFKQHRLCFSWSTEILKLSHVTEKDMCPTEQETVTLLSSVYAASGESFGITKTLQPFSDQLLEHLRLKAVSYARCTFALWLFVSEVCRQDLCGVLHHLDRQDRYVSPALFLKPSGRLHVQMSGEAQQSGAFLCPFEVPLRRWCHVSVELHGTTVLVSMTCLEGDQRTVHSAEHVFDFPLVLDDTDGCFVIGGGRFVRSVEGFFGPVLFYRNRVPALSQTKLELPRTIHALDLSVWLQRCQDLQRLINLKIHKYSLRKEQRDQRAGCVDVYRQYTHRHRRVEAPPLCGDWEAVPRSHKHAVKVAEILVSRRGRGVSLKAVGGSLYRRALRRTGRSLSPLAVRTVLPLLQQAGCLGDRAALHLSAALSSAGLGAQARPDKRSAGLQSWRLSLISAQKDHRLSLLRLGFLHLHGLDGLDKDPDLAYAYYSNIAQQTVGDRENPSAQQTFVEEVYLDDHDALDQQTHEDHHIFQWLKFLAQKGEAAAEQTMGRMLFWGQQGVASDLEKAVGHYERGATLHEDPVSMYDYGIVLLQGQGVEQDIPKGVFYLKKAMDKGSVFAMNALAWYFEHYEKNYQEAVRLWEQADLQGSPDAAMNLGVLHLRGLYPGAEPDQFLAYQYFLKSANRGHMSAANHVAEIWTTGLPGFVDRRPSDAVRLSKWVAEQNGYLGSVLRSGLDSYLKNDILKSLLFYLMAAECGFAAGQFNVAFLCEQNAGNTLPPQFASSCMWKYYNLTVHSESPRTYALIKLGDLLYQGRGGRWRDADSAARMYSAAALREQPQGLYNLGVLVEEGHELPLSVLSDLGLPSLYSSDRSVLLKTIYQKCRDSDDEDSYLPCGLALFHVYLQELRQDYSVGLKFWSVLVATLAPVLYFLLSRYLCASGQGHQLRPGVTGSVRTQ